MNYINALDISLIPQTENDAYLEIKNIPKSELPFTWSSENNDDDPEAW